jgi:mRNA interferase HicA
MPKLPTDIKPKKLIVVLKKHGFLEKGGKGSHVKLVHPDGRWTQVAVHPKPILTGTLQAILRQSGLTIEDIKNAR